MGTNAVHVTPCAICILSHPLASNLLQVPLDELDAIMEFIRSASGSGVVVGGGGGGGGVVGGGGGGGVSPPPATPSTQMQAALMQQVMEMGFDQSRAHAALERSGWSLEGALAVLLQ